MKLLKQWHLQWFNETDIEYVRGLGCNYEVHDTVKTQEVIASNGQAYRYVVDKDASYGLEFITENEQQESMVMLKYAGDVKLLRMWYVNEWAQYDFQSDI